MICTSWTIHELHTAFVDYSTYFAVSVYLQVNLCQKHLFSTNPQYDISLFIDLPVQYMKTASSEHVVYINCSECQNKNKKQFVYTTGSEIVVFMY